MYERDYQIEWFLCDHKGDLKPVYLFKMLSEIMERNATSYGAGAEYHRIRQMVWVLIEYEIDVKRMPKAEEIVTVGTLPYSFKKMYGFRVYQIKDSLGNIILSGKGKFVLIDLKNKSITKPDNEMLSKFTDAIKEPIALPFEKAIFERENLIFETFKVIHHGHLDANNHVNNAEYIGIAYESIPKIILEEMKVCQINVYYKKETLLDDEVNIKVFQEKSGVLVEIRKDENLHTYILFKQKS